MTQKTRLFVLCLIATIQYPLYGIELDRQHLLLDGSLTNEQVKAQPFVYNNIQEVMQHLCDTTTIFIRPWVYWVDDPDHPEVVKGINGREPFGMVIRTKNLSLIGLGDNPQDVILASQRGQTQGAVGNFTMFNFIVDELVVENLTMGNYCNVDLDYPQNPTLSRAKRSPTITQAHVGYVKGNLLRAKKVRFISRLNLNPLNGAKESLYDSCHFECTDDALNGGNVIYRHCDFDLYSSKPLWSTHGSGPLFEDCDFYIKSHNKETYFCKQGGPVTILNCRYHAPEGSYVGWTTYPQRWLRCYQKGFTLNGKPYLIGNRQPENTLLPDSIIGIPFLPISQHKVELRAPAQLHLSSEENVTWHIEKGFESFVSLNGQENGNVVFQLENETDKTVDFCIMARTNDGREAACQVILKPSLLPAPHFTRTPIIRKEKDSLILLYSLDLQELKDKSEINWFRDNICVSRSLDFPQRSYYLTQADEGHKISAIITPRHQRSLDGIPIKCEIVIKKATWHNQLETDFHDFPCEWQSKIIEGFWTVDGFKPIDTQEHEWSFDSEKPMWEYGEGFNGAIGKGLLQAQRGARLRYTPIDKKYDSMAITLQVDPTKTAGQGFGSATAQYMDVCLKFDTKTLTGYGLRIIRTVKYASAVDFLLVKYQNGVVVPITEPISATCYRTGCTININYHKGLLSSHVETTTPKPNNSQLPHQVDLKAKVAPTPFGGILIQHTGTCGESTTMLHHLKIEW